MGEAFRTFRKQDSRHFAYGVRLRRSDDEAAFRGTAAQPAVIERATHPEPARRHSRVRELVEAWRGTS